jgi:hypothetical protein
MKKISFIWLLLGAFTLPFFSFSQTWSKEEQAFLDYFNNAWKQMSNKPTTWEFWKATTHPDDKLCWWWTDQGMPNDLNTLRTMFQNLENQGVVANNFHIRPVKINIVGEVAMIWLYGYITQTDKAGKVTEWEDKRLEVFKRDGSGWIFLGGMVDKVAPSN